MRKKYPNCLQQRERAPAVSVFGMVTGEMHPQMPMDALALQARGTVIGNKNADIAKYLCTAGAVNRL